MQKGPRNEMSHRFAKGFGVLAWIFAELFKKFHGSSFITRPEVEMNALYLPYLKMKEMKCLSGSWELY